MKTAEIPQVKGEQKNNFRKPTGFRKFNAEKKKFENQRVFETMFENQWVFESSKPRRNNIFRKPTGFRKFNFRKTNGFSKILSGYIMGYKS